MLRSHAGRKSKPPALLSDSSCDRLCVVSPAVAGEESHRDQRRDGRLRESLLHFSVPEDPQPPRGNSAVPELCRGGGVNLDVMDFSL